MRSLQTAAARGCDMLDKESVIKKVNHLLNSQSGRKSKYQRNYNLYVGSMSSDIDSAAPSILGFMPANYSATLENDTPKFNVIKSAIDSVVSKISQARCRPFVNCNMGSHKTFMIARNLQSFLDSYCDVQNLNKKVAAILRDAMIFDTGYLFFNADSVEWLRALPWDVYLDPQEVSGNGSELKNLYIEFRNFPLDQLDEDTKKLLTDDERERTYIIYSLYFNANTETKAIFINRRIKKIEKGYKKIPLIIFHYCEPLVGSSAISVADMLCGIQEQIDILLKKISEASRLSVANNYFVPKSLGVSASRLNNRIGNVIPINSAAEDIQVFNPEFINPQYMELLNDLIERAYNLVGVSQLSSQGKKETGITSGIAISTMESLENDRFELELHQYIDCFTNICKTMIEVMGTSDKYKKDTLMVKSRYTYETTWESVKEETDKLKLMFSSADLLSKDPNEKLKQLQTLAQAGLLPVSKIGQLMELPDIQSGFSFISNAENACQTVINKALYQDDYEIPDYISLQLLKENIQNTQMLLRSAEGEGDSNEKDIDKLQKLYEKADEIDMKLEELQQGDVEAGAAAAQGADIAGSAPQSVEAEQNKGVANKYESINLSGNSNA